MFSSHRTVMPASLASGAQKLYSSAMNLATAGGSRSWVWRPSRSALFDQWNSERAGLESRVYADFPPDGDILKEEPPAAKPAAAKPP